MSQQPPTPNIGLVLPVPNSGQPWRTTDYNTLFTTIDTAFGADRTRLSTLEGSVDPAGIGSKGIPAGSTSARDAFWGIPSDDPGGLALQQKGARWFNTDLGREESYYGKYDASTNKTGWLARGWQPTVTTGWNLIRPGSVAGSGVSISAEGAVALAAAASASVNNAFWGLFTEYLVELNLNTLSGATPSSLAVKLRGAGADLSSASYNWAMQFANSTTPGAAFQLNQTSWQAAAGISATDLEASMSFISPAEAKRTLMRVRAVAASVSAILVNDMAGINTANTAYDGFTLSTISGSMTGTMKIFGLFRGGA